MALEQVLIVLQGHSGSGKSTLARMLQTSLPAVVTSADNFRINADGEYEFRMETNQANHERAQQYAEFYLSRGSSVIVDNTNIRRWECRPYVEMAVKMGIKVLFLRCMGEFPNSHGVPPEVIQKQKECIETLTVESVLSSDRPPAKTV
jgi:predicted kinase